MADERGRDRGDHAPAFPNRADDLGQIIARLFGVLRADDDAPPAEDTLVRQDFGLCVREPDRLDRAGADTFVTVFTVCLFEAQNIGHRLLQLL